MDSERRWQIVKQPREWQLAAIDEWRPTRRGILGVVTGAGKTVFAQMCMLDFLEEYPEGRFIIVVPTVALLDQWHLSLTEDLHVGEGEIALYCGTERPNNPRKVNILVLNTARDRAAPIAERFPCNLLIIDECHRAGTPSNRKALLGPHQATLGLSATAFREHDDGFERWLEPALGPIVFEYGYEDARTDGVITPFNLMNIRVDLLHHEEEQYKTFSRRIARLRRAKVPPEEKEQKLERLLQRRAAVASCAAMRVPVAVKLAELHARDRCIVFHERIQQADQIAQMLLHRGIRVTMYHTRIGQNLRLDNLRLFRRGVFDCLVTCRALDEGTNVPETRVAIIASSTSSVRQRIQRLGRVLRPAPGKDCATIYTIYATSLEERRLALEASRLAEIADTKWMAGALRKDAQDTDR
jgi:superfamily II DNA or RNA helicase